MKSSHASFHILMKRISSASTTGTSRVFFIDDYATVPLMSIRRLLALSRAGKLSILKLGEHYEIRTAEEGLERGAEV